MKFRTDVMYSLIAFESVLVAIAAVLWFPSWVLAVAIAAFVFATIEMVVSIARMRKQTYVEANGKYAYKFPIMKFIVYAVLLTCITALALLVMKRLFGWAMLPLTLLVVGLLVFAIVKKIKLMAIISAVLAFLLVVTLLGYGMAQLVHSGVNLNPGLVAQNEQNPEETDTPDENQPPVEDSEDNQTPSDDTQAPNEENQTPGDDTQAPNEENQTPDDDTQNTTGNIKITCPDTMKYGVPVTITVEGIDVDNLVYGNEDFISIVKVSDTQVVLTLVGIVNDAGQVEIVPAAGYITVTDSVSGTNFSIRIVE